MVGVSWDGIHATHKRTRRSETGSQKEESNTSRFKSRKNWFG